MRQRYRSTTAVNTIIPRHRYQPRWRGIALLLVVTVLAAAAVMGMAILSSTALQASVSGNVADIASADALAESGINYAMYQLECLTEEEIADGEFWAGEANISLGSAVEGDIDVVVTRPDPSVHQYLIESTGNAESGAGTVSRTVRAVVQLNLTFQPKHAAAFNSGLLIPGYVTIVGPVRSAGTLQLTNTIKVSGLVRAPLVIVPPIPIAIELLTLTNPQAVPTSFRNYLQYEYDGQTYNAQLISSGSISNVTYNPDPLTNPAGIFWADGAITLQSNVTINGTLYVKRKDASNPSRLTLDGTGVVIRAQDGYPALIVDERIRLLNTPRSANIYGLVWAGDGIMRGSLLQSGHALNIYGSFMTARVGTPFDALFSGTVRIEYRPEYVNVPDFSTMNNAPQSVKVMSWQRAGL